MSKRCLLFLLAMCRFGYLGLLAQATPAPRFTVADVHISPHHSFPFWTGGVLRGDRYSLHQATIVDLIREAYGVDDENVQGGPTWLETDRFDVIAKAPANTPPATVKLMLQSLLAERFNLKLHAGSNPVAAYALSLGRGKSTLTESDGSGDSGCRDTSPIGGPYNVLSCRNITMEAFAREIRTHGGDYLDHPVVDDTRLKGSYDFDLHWSWKYQLDKQGISGISLFDAIDKQLGLKLALQTSPRPVLIVDSVAKTPTPNVASIDQLLPPPPLAQFEVAVLKPTKPGVTEQNGRLNGDELKFSGFPVKLLIAIGWQLNYIDPEVLVNAPKWLDEDRYDLVAKIPAEVVANASNPQRIDQEDFDGMIQRLLEERFHLKTHFETRTVNAYSLTAVNPRLTKADPLSRTRCTEGPGPDGKDPRIANKVLDRLVYCQNMTSAAIGEELQHIANGYIYGPVVDETGLKGGWNFTLSFSSIGTLRAAEKAGANAASDGTATDPSAAISLFDAVKRELGLKLEKTKRPGQVLVIDHIEQKPTEN